MIGQRVRLLIGLIALGGLVVVARLAQVQLREHDDWSTEAARLVSFGRVTPYERGRIRDARGVVLAKDKQTHHLVLVYREFRRGHPLGQVAHARSLLEGRPVPIPEAYENLVAWTHELVHLTPREVAAFADGGALTTPTLAVRALGEEESAARARRAADLRFYLRRLLGLGTASWRRLVKDAADGLDDRTYLELAARRLAEPGERAPTPDEAWDGLAARLGATLDYLDRFGRRLDWGEDEAVRDPLARLIDELEQSRRWVEDAAASKLFADAAGFAPGRVAPRTLRAFFDLSWLQRLLVWDDARLDEWANTARERWVSDWRDGYALAQLVVDLRLDPAFEPGPDAILDRLAAVFAPDGAVEGVMDDPIRQHDWRRVDDLAVFDQLGDLFEAEPPPELRRELRAVLPFQEEGVRALELPIGQRWKLIDAVLATDGDEGERLRDALDSSAETFERMRAVIEDWERRAQSALLDALTEIHGAASARARGPDGRLRLARHRVRRAEERADFFLKDYGMRPRSLQRREPGYDVIYLLTRYEEYFPGFEAREASERVYAVLPGDEARLAGRLIGDVSSVDLYDLRRQRNDAQRLAELRNLPDRSKAEEVELLQLVGRVLLHDEVKGVSGVEGWWNEELIGRNGYRERRGLEDVSGRGARSFVRESIDGRDLQLTLDSELQRAAERTLRFPERVADREYDDAWAAEPVGAIVAITPRGDVLIAASEPNEASDVAFDDDDPLGQRGVLIERTLRQPTFQPPGSVFKPFVAAWALEEEGLDPSVTVECGPIERGGAGYVDVRCHTIVGHGQMDLAHALEASCNAYFAWLGEQLPPTAFFDMAHEFGFGEPSGVRARPPWDSGLRRRVGLREDVPGLFEDSMNDFNRRLAGNGLAVVQVTPMQLARATAGLATGRLPRLRLVDRIGDEILPREASRAIEIDEANLERVRESMKRVASSAHGTAHRALNVDEVGFEVAAKTGSADLVSRNDEEGRTKVRKHTWVAGWVPADDPELVFVVFVHDTSATSSHGAVYLTRQFLQQPEVAARLMRGAIGPGHGGPR